METDDVKITYESLFELLRTEKDRHEIQKLDSNFYKNLVDYLKEKNKIMDETGQQEIFSAEERVKTQKQVENVKRIIKELYERRQKKIIEIALDQTKTKANLIDTSVFLKEEKELLDTLLNTLNESRDNVLLKIMDSELPKEIETKAKETPEVQDGPSSPEPSNDVKAAGDVEQKKTKLVRFIHAVPKFVGPELEEYGPFEEEDVASLPAEIADILIKKKRSEEMSGD